MVLLMEVLSKLAIHVCAWILTNINRLFGGVCAVFFNHFQLFLQPIFLSGVF